MGDQTRPALPVTGTGMGHTETSAQAATCPWSLGWAGEELEKGRGSSPVWRDRGQPSSGGFRDRCAPWEGPG